MVAVAFPDVCERYSFDDYLRDNDICPDRDFTYGWNDCRCGEAWEQYKEDNEPKVLLMKEYNGFESLPDMIRDVEECDWIPDDIGAEYEGSVEVIIKYRKHGS